MMAGESRYGGLLFFCLKFLILVIPLVVLWWLLIPAYGWFLIQVCGSILRIALGVPIQAGHIEAEGILNTNSIFFIETAEQSFRNELFAVLVTNLPPFIALILATSGLKMMRRIRILAVGSGIIVAGHILFIVLSIKYGASLSGAEIPTAIMQFFLTLPFLLWIVFAYWDRILEYLSENEGTQGK